MKADILEIDLIEALINFKIRLKETVADFFIQMMTRIIDMNRQMHFEHIKASHPGTEVKFGKNQEVPPFYAVMKLEGSYQWISDEKVDIGVTKNRYECRQWTLWNEEDRKKRKLIR